MKRSILISKIKMKNYHKVSYFISIINLRVDIFNN